MMNILFELLEQAIQKNIFELRLVSGSKPSFRHRKVWRTMSDEIMTHAQMREQVMSILSDDEKNKLMDRGMSSGLLQFNNNQFYYVISQAQNGLHFHISWKNENVDLQDFYLPYSLLEIYKKSAGLHLISGPRFSGRTTMAKLLTEKICDGGLYSAAIFADHPEEYNLKNKEEPWQIFRTELLAESHEILNGFDLILVDSQKIQAWRHAVNISESGIKTFLILPFGNVISCLQRLSEKIEVANYPLGLGKLSDLLSTAIALRLIPGIEKDLQSGFELLLLTEKMKAAVSSGNWNLVTSTMLKESENNGMKTLNQSLMNLILKRKIDIKAGFAESLEPEKLDQMLNQVGI